MGQTKLDRLNIPFSAGIVGSLPRPETVKDILSKTTGAESADSARSRQMDAAVRYAITLQETAGLDVVSDGEWRRHAYTHIIADIAEGFSYDPRPGRWGITVTEPLEICRPGLIADEAKFLVQSTECATKVCIPSPYLLGVRLWEKEWSSKAYPTRNEFIESLVPILYQEILALKDTGVSIIQIDEPHLCVLVDPKVRATFDNADYEMEFAAAKINELIENVKGVRLALHLCRRNWGRSGWGAEGGYEPIIDTIKRIHVDQYVMEFSIPVAGDVSILKQLPEDSLIGLGCVECRFEHLNSPQEIVSRVEEAMRYVEPERISLNPDCGFAPGLEADIPLDEAYLKLKNESEAAYLLREKYA